MLHFLVSNRKESFQLDHATGSLEFGREPRDGQIRCVLKDPYVSADHLRVMEIAPGKIRIENLSRKVPVQLADGTVIGMLSHCEVGLPSRLTIGQTLIEVRCASTGSDESSPLMTVAEPVQGASLTRPFILEGLTGAPDAAQLTRWFEAVVSIQRAAANSPEFYQEIARAVVELIGLDCGLVLLRKGEHDDWQTVARHAGLGAPLIEVSRTILARVCNERRTFYQAAGQNNLTQSLAGISAVVASPILASDNKTVLGAVYGVRSKGGEAQGPEIRPLHAQLLQVLATAASAGIARMSSEAEATRKHVQFEQFFGSGLADELDRNPGLLGGRECEVTVLVSDIRKFSRIAERLGPRETCELIGDVLDRLTARIHEYGGVVVDYVGDGILAMWNAPVAQPDHAVRACRAALAMIGELPDLNEQWSKRAESELALGIGVNTGLALVGNTGSRHRMKYGPLGNTVNLASRVEGATKQLGVPVLITGETHARLVEPFATRRLCQVRVVGIETPVDLHELYAETAAPDWFAARDAYQTALSLFEAHRLSEACTALFPLLEDAERRHDTPALTLAARAVEARRSPLSRFDPVVTLESK